LSQGWSNILLFNNQMQRPNLLNKKVAEGKLLGRQPPGFFGLAQLGDHLEGNMQSYLWREALIFHLKLRRQWDLGQSDGGLKHGWSIILRFDNQLQGRNLLNKKVTERKLLRRQPSGIFGLVQLGDHFKGNMQSHLRQEVLIFHHGLGANR
jgi:hypothetical protein